MPKQLSREMVELVQQDLAEGVPERKIADRRGLSRGSVSRIANGTVKTEDRQHPATQICPACRRPGIVVTGAVECVVCQAHRWREARGLPHPGVDRFELSGQPSPVVFRPTAVVDVGT